jgi:hypothetical protein
VRRVALQASQSVVTTGTTPTALTPSASETVADSSFGTEGVWARVITTGTATTVTVNDPGFSPSGNAGTALAIVCPSTGVRMILIPRGAINPATGLATILFSGALTGVTYELYRS